MVRRQHRERKARAGGDRRDPQCRARDRREFRIPAGDRPGRIRASTRLPRCRAPRPRACFSSSIRPGSPRSRNPGRRSATAATPTRSSDAVRPLRGARSGDAPQDHGAARRSDRQCRDGGRLHPAERRTCLADRIGRAPTEGELYVAHFLGAVRRRRADQSRRTQIRARPRRASFRTPPRPIARSSTTARASARSVAEVYHVLVGRYDVAPRRAVRRRRAARLPPTSRSGRRWCVAAVAVDARRRVNAGRRAERAGSQIMRDRSSTACSAATDARAGVAIRAGSVDDRPVVAAALTAQVDNQVERQVADRAVRRAELGPPSPASPPAGAPGAPLDLFSDRPTDVRGSFGVSS